MKNIILNIDRAKKNLRVHVSWYKLHLKLLGIPYHVHNCIQVGSFPISGNIWQFLTPDSTSQSKVLVSREDLRSKTNKFFIGKDLGPGWQILGEKFQF